MIKPISFIDLAKQQKRLKKDIDSRIKDVLLHGKYIMGPEVYELEEELVRYTGANYAATCGSGTDAIVLALMAIGVGRGDIVFCPTFTFPATAEAIVILGAKPYFVDVDKNTFNISILSLNKAIEDVQKQNQYNAKAIIAVDLYGIPADYDQLSIIAKKNNMVLIADAAQSFGAEFNGKKVGNIADITCISFFPAKPLGCYGDGGSVLTNDNNIIDMVKSLRVHGKGKSKYDIDYIGLNSRLDTLQAGILLAKLKNFNWEFNKRNKIAKYYIERLKDKISVPEVSSNSRPVWAQFTLKHKERDKIQELLKERGIPTMVYYPRPMHKQKAYKKYYNGNIPLSGSNYLAKQVFSIPIYPDMDEKEQNYIIDAILDIVNQYKL